MRFQVQELFDDFHSGDETHVMFYYGWLNFWIKCSERLPEASGKIEAIIRPVTGVSHDVCCWARFQPYCTCIINTANRLDTNKTGGNAKRAFQSRKSPKSCRALQSYKTPGDWARELSKPSTHCASLVVKIEKKRFSFLVGVSGRDVTKKACFGIWPLLAGPGPQPIDPLFWLKVLLETRSKSASVEPWIEFLAYL